MPSHYRWQTSTVVLKKSTDGNNLCPTGKKPAATSWLFFGYTAPGLSLLYD